MQFFAMVCTPSPQDMQTMHSGAAAEIALHLARTPSFMQHASATSVTTTVLPAAFSAATTSARRFRIADHGQNLFQRLFLCNNHKM